jgi:CRP-like cAMP-binding protein
LEDLIPRSKRQSLDLRNGHESSFSYDGCSDGIALFHGIPKKDKDELTQWLHGIKTIKYERGEKVVHEGMPAFGLHLICHGRVKIVQSTDTQQKLIVKIVCPGQMFGEESLLGDHLYTYSAEAMDTCYSKFLRQEELEKIITRFPILKENFSKKLALEIKALQLKLLELTHNSCKDKVARLLIMLGEAFGEHNDKGQLQINLNRIDLAQMAGISCATAIRTLAHFEARGWLDVHYHTITVIDPAALESSTPLGVSTPQIVR